MDWALVLDADCLFRYASPSLGNTFGFSSDEVLGRSGWEFVHPDDRPRVQTAFERVIQSGGATEVLLFRVINSSGEWLWVEEVFTNLLDDPNVSGIVCNGRDVSERVRAEQALNESEAKYRAIAETSQEGIWVVTLSGHTVYANQRMAELLGTNLKAMYAKPAPSWFGPETAAFVADRLQRRRVIGPEGYELVYAHPDGSMRFLHFSVSPHGVDDKPESLAMVSDVTETTRAQEALRRGALYDDLTGLPNRTLLADRVAQALSRNQRYQFGQVAVLFLNLDRFKLVNDSLGHAIGDELLRAVADRLQDLPGIAGATLARFSGDEFVLLAEESDPSQADALAKQALEALRPPFRIGPHQLYVSGSIGIALSPARSADDLLRFANSALHEAKTVGRGQAVRFDPEIAAAAADRLSLSNDLRDALSHDDLDLYYQPVVDLQTGGVVAVEALARWKHPDRGCVPPDVFVSVAESTGLCAELDYWALERACRDHHQLTDAIGVTATVAVNISARHFTHTGLEETVLAVTRRWGTDRRRLTLEITESALMERPAYASGMLESLRQHGITAALDDFGTGYSSLGYLSQLPVSTLKIDRTFIKSITEDPDSLAIVTSIVEMAKALGLCTVAEGIETNEQLTVLRRLGCNVGQGFLWSPAVPLEELPAVVRALAEGPEHSWLRNPQTHVGPKRGRRRPPA